MKKIIVDQIQNSRSTTAIDVFPNPIAGGIVSKSSETGNFELVNAPSDLDFSHKGVQGESAAILEFPLKNAEDQLLQNVNFRISALYNNMIYSNSKTRSIRFEVYDGSGVQLSPSRFQHEDRYSIMGNSYDYIDREPAAENDIAVTWYQTNDVISSSHDIHMSIFNTGSEYWIHFITTSLNRTTSNSGYTAMTTLNVAYSLPLTADLTTLKLLSDSGGYDSAYNVSAFNAYYEGDVS